MIVRFWSLVSLVLVDLVPGGPAALDEFLGEQGLKDELFSEPDILGRCERGTAPVPKRDAHKFIEINGCGKNHRFAKSERELEAHGITPCCNVHDVCYSICGANQTWCDDEFWTCVKKKCNQKGWKDDRKMCKKFGASMKGYTTEYFFQHQRETCMCVDAAHQKQAHQEYLWSFLKEHNPANATRKVMDDFLKKFEGNEVQLYLNLVMDHGKDFVRW
eukprot:CAMPEP_0169090398 /NCGR_PEP_ID=MMETSP1015-20121227/15795_1 /TAXON_ID=342587 /ORGANISM="Karlodinium micrum, Strain CCMP2283" /LENGTH=216 /DNA_ID=CAMNT_0009150795 /DNA_START=51 /DNA_END=698 /DNA_ORIENTATION=-